MRRSFLMRRSFPDSLSASQPDPSFLITHARLRLAITRVRGAPFGTFTFRIEPQMATAPQNNLTSTGPLLPTRAVLRWTVGLVALSVATGLGVGYFVMTNLTTSWTVTEHVAFRTVVVFIALMGLTQIGLAMSATRGVMATPRFGSHRVLIPSEGFAYLGIMCVLFTGAMLTKQNTLLLVFAMMAGPFVVNGSLTFGMLKATRIARSAPRRAMAGELFGVEVTLTNRHPLLALWMMTVRDEIRHAAEALSVNVLFARVAPRTAQAGHYQLRLARRGRYQLGPLLVSSRFPLGLVERSRQFAEPGEVLVYPRIGRLNPQWKRHWLGAAELVARPQPKPGVFHDEFHRLREFRTGDNPRDIHWRTSARRGELILREYQQNRSLNLAVVVDFYQSPLKPFQAVSAASSAVARDEDHELLERTLSLALTLIVEHGCDCRDGTLSLAAAGVTSFRWEGQSVSASLEALFDGLALLEPGAAAMTNTLLDETLLCTTTSTQVVLLTTRSAEMSETFGPAARNPRVHVVRIDSLDQLESILQFEDDTTARKVE